MFTPGVRVILSWKDIEIAVEKRRCAAFYGAHAVGLLGRLGCSTRVEIPRRESALAATPLCHPSHPHWPMGGQHSAVAAVPSGPRFSFTHTLYYFGGLLAMGAMSCS